VRRVPPSDEKPVSRRMNFGRVAIAGTVSLVRHFSWSMKV
jgi:hypothetical protein